MPSVNEIKVVTRHYSRLTRMWVPTLSAWGIVGGTALLYFTDWKVIMRHVPYVGKKYDHESPR